jgi:hypothetical protein
MPMSKKTNAAQDKRSGAVSKTRAKASRPPAKSATVYQLKITLNDIRPPVWRRVLTRDCTLARLHDIIQVVMGWEDYHLHLFEIGGESYGHPQQWSTEFGDDEDTLNERKLKLSQIVAHGVHKFTYEYDMGDSWRHTIMVEKTVPADRGLKYPRCVDGRRACPPEDCGGPWGYGDFVEAIQDPKHEQHEELLEWVGGEFDPEAFDPEAVNEELLGVG